MPHLFFLNLSNVFSPCVLLRSLGEIPDPVHSGTKPYKPVISSATFSSDDALKFLSWKTWVWVTYESGSGFEVIHSTIRPFQWHCHDLILYFFCLSLSVFVSVWGGLKRARLNDITDQFSINLHMWWDFQRGSDCTLCTHCALFYRLNRDGNY